MYDVSHLYKLRDHNSIVFPPPQFYCFPSASTILLYSTTAATTISAIRVWESVAYTSFSTESSRELLKGDVKKLYIPKHKLYEQYYVNQARQKGGNLPYRLFKDPDFSKGMA